MENVGDEKTNEKKHCTELSNQNIETQIESNMKTCHVCCFDR